MNASAFAVNLAASAAAALAVMLATFALALVKGVHRIVDVAWGLAFTAVALVTYGLSTGHGDEVRRLAVTLATCLWGLRLAFHIARRGRGQGEDPRRRTYRLTPAGRAVAAAEARRLEAMVAAARDRRLLRGPA